MKFFINILLLMGTIYKIGGANMFLSETKRSFRNKYLKIAE